MRIQIFGGHLRGTSVQLHGNFFVTVDTTRFRKPRWMALFWTALLMSAMLTYQPVLVGGIVSCPRESCLLV